MIVILIDAVTYFCINLGKNILFTLEFFCFLYKQSKVNIRMIKPCSVIYLPGAGGNFFSFCLALSQETVPVYDKNLHELDDEQVDLVISMKAEQRKKFLQINDLTNFRRVHKKNTDGAVVYPDFYYPNKKINDRFDWAISVNHPDNYDSKLPWLKKIIYLDINNERYIKWTTNARHYFEKLGYTYNFSNDSIKNSELTKQIKLNPITLSLSMDEVLDSQAGFEKQYLLACSALSITPELEHAIDIYQGWRRFRVDPFC